MDIAVSRPTLIFSVQTLEARPNRVLLARAMASFGVRNVTTVNTGPNICTHTHYTHTYIYAHTHEHGHTHTHTYLFLHTDRDRLNFSYKGRWIKASTGRHISTCLIHLGKKNTSNMK